MNDTVRERFVAVDQKGRRYTITVYQRWIGDEPTLADAQPKPIEGTPYALAVDYLGQPRNVTMLNDDGFQVFGNPLWDDEELIPVTRL